MIRSRLTLPFRSMHMFFAMLLAMLLAASPVLAQVSATPASRRAVPRSFVVPQWRSVQPGGPGGQGQIIIRQIDAGVDILEQVATTTMEITVENTGTTRLESVLLVPVPDGAVVRGFTFQGAGKEPTAELLRKEDARRIYDAIVAQTRDPALLEFVGYNLMQSSVFPVEPRSTQKVRLTYEHLLPADGSRVDYVLPRSESVDYSVPWNVTVRVAAKKPISTIYSPSHKIETNRKSSEVVMARLAPDAVRDPGAFRLSYLLETGGVTASMFAYPDPKTNGGYFLLLAGLPAKPAEHDKENGIKREVTIVIDRSGSMNGEKLEQVREAALQVVAGLEDGEAFNIIIYNEGVEAFAKEPVVKDDASTKQARDYIKDIKARGGTNIHDALLEALRPKPIKGFLPLVLFLTDGLPTVGQTSEKSIREMALKGNRYERRIFTFGVGTDVNTPLLERVAFETRATSTFVLPQEDVELKVAQVFKRLAGPVLAGTAIEATGPDGKPARGRIMDVLPTRLPDMFDGDQLVLLGRYVGEEPVTFQISGNYLGKEKAFKFTFKPDKATTRNAFVPRLWASRKIGDLVDAIRQLGADHGAIPGSAPPANATNDPRLKELIDEVVRLSTEFGILTEYTAFLAREGTDLAQKDAVYRLTLDNFVDRAWSCRSGVASLNQEENYKFQKGQSFLNGTNRYVDEKLNTVTINNVQQVNDKAFYRRGSQWIDAEVIDHVENVKPSRVIDFGSQEYSKLIEKLAADGRNGCASLRGDILMRIDGETILVRMNNPTENAK
ncbi:MAG: VIT domain-containing protein [Phycisphaeraceae bacterium]